MMREKIFSVLRPEFHDARYADDVVDRILAAICDGQDPVAVVSTWNEGGSGEFKTIEGTWKTLPNGTRLYTAPQPAPDVSAMQARIAELERDTSEVTAARQFLKEQARQLTRIAELERVQGVLVWALDALLRDYAAVHGTGDLEMQPSLHQARTALAAWQKLEGVKR